MISSTCCRIHPTPHRPRPTIDTKASQRHLFGEIPTSTPMTSTSINTTPTTSTPITSNSLTSATMGRPGTGGSSPGLFKSAYTLPEPRVSPPLVRQLSNEGRPGSSSATGQISPRTLDGPPTGSPKLRQYSISEAHVSPRERLPALHASPTASAASPHGRQSLPSLQSQLGHLADSNPANRELPPPTQLDLDWSPVLTKNNERILKLGDLMVVSSPIPHSPHGKEGGEGHKKLARFFGGSTTKKRQRLVMITSSGRIVFAPAGGEEKKAKQEISLLASDCTWKAQIDAKGQPVWCVDTVSKITSPFPPYPLEYIFPPLFIR